MKKPNAYTITTVRYDYVECRNYIINKYKKNINAFYRYICEYYDGGNDREITISREGLEDLEGYNNTNNLKIREVYELFLIEFENEDGEVTMYMSW